MNFPLPHIVKTSPSKSLVATSLPVQIWRKRRVFAIVFAIAFLPALAALMILRPVYYASGTVIIGNQEPSSSGASAAWIEKLGDPADLESQLLIVLSHRMLRLALERPGVTEAVQQECSYRGGIARLLTRSEDCAGLEAGSQELLDHVEARYSVHAVGRSRIISIGYQSPLPDVAFTLANALLITYLEDQRAENAHSREAAAAWVLRESKKLNTPAVSSAAQEKFFQDLYNKTNDFEAERRVLVSSGRLVSLAEVPRAPYFPKRAPLLAAGLTIALLLAGFAAIRFDVTDRTVRRTSELEALTKVPVLAILPSSDVPGERRPSRITHVMKRWWNLPKEKIAFLTGLGNAPQGPSVAEAARALYARLMLLGGSKAPRRIMVASASHSEGTTLAAMALGRAAADKGRKVLVIDFDFAGHAELGSAASQATAGLAGILRGEIEPPQAVRHALPGLDLIPAGRITGDPALLLINGHLPKLMNWVQDYDLVLLNGPAADADILAGHADGVLWCARWGHTLQCDVDAAMEDLRQQRVNVLGLVITMADPVEFRLYERPRLQRPRYAEGY